MIIFQVKESPRYPNQGKPKFHKHYNAIGEFYNYILRAFAFLTQNGKNQTIFTGNKSKQLDFKFSFGRYGKLISVTNFTKAKEAIEEIIKEGEGSSPCNPFDWSKDNGDLSHYFLFQSIVEQHKIKVYNYGADDGEGDGDSGVGKETIPILKVCAITVMQDNVVRTCIIYNYT